jgi:hypothetical protein
MAGLADAGMVVSQFEFNPGMRQKTELVPDLLRNADLLTVSVAPAPGGKGRQKHT